MLLLILILIVFTLFWLLRCFRPAHVAGSGWETYPWVRWTQGFLTHLPLRLLCTAAILLCPYVLWYLVVKSDRAPDRLFSRLGSHLSLLIEGYPYDLRTLSAEGLLLLAFAFSRKPARFLLQGVSVATKPVRRLRAASRQGYGDSGGFADQWSEIDTRYKPGAVFLGVSLYDRGRWIGQLDDRGLLTLGSSRIGKQLCGTIPALLLWPHSAVITDCKGQHAYVTGARRGHGGGRVTEFLGQDVLYYDPWGRVSGVRSCYYNALDEINPYGASIFEDVMALADAMVVPDPRAEAHWNDGARSVLAAAMMHLLIRYPGNASLPQVRRLLMSPPDVFKTLLAEMLNNRSRGGFVAAAAARIMRGIDFGEINSILSSTDKHLEWLSSPELQKTLSRSDFSMDALKKKPTTLYIVVPTEDLNQHNRLVRVFQTMGLRSAAKAKSKIPILYVMDEFYSMGRSEALARQIANIPGYNIKLWPILQNLGQLIELYPRNWQTFIANTGAFQIIGANDRETLTLTREMLGQHLVQGRAVNLRENNEIGMMTSRESGCSIVVRNGASPLYIARCPYFRLFGKHQYGPDPEHHKS